MKRLVALSLVLLLSIESFAAVVSDNDGSAFITKAEFDSLKNDFQNQIDQYNTSIDSKIDGAISSYLAGLNLAKETNYNVEFKGWEKVLAVNYVLPETWRIPDMNLTFNYEYSSVNNMGNWWEIWWGTAAILYTRPKTTAPQVRNMIIAGVEPSNYTLPNKVVWLGQSCDYIDKITAVKAGVCKSIWGRTESKEAYEYSYLYAATNGSSSMSVIYPLQFAKGNIDSDTVENKWASMLWWQCWNSERCYALKPTEESGWLNRNLSTSISLGYVDGKQYQNEHIINWNNLSYSNLSDPTWTNSLGPNPDWTEQTVLNTTQVTKKGKWGVLELNDQVRNGQNEDTWKAAVKQYVAGSTVPQNLQYQPNSSDFAAFYSGGYGGTRTNNMMSVGVLDKTYTSADIYQWKDQHALIRDEKKNIENINLYNGLLIGYAKTDEEFKWEPKITGTYRNGSSDVTVPKWRVKLSKTPFGINDSVTAPTDVLKNKNQTEDYLVTNETTGTCKFDVEIGEDTTIYCKWWPDDTNICNNYNWSGTLDLTACGTYTIRESS